MINIVFCDDDTSFLDRMTQETNMVLNELKIQSNIYTFSNGYDLIESFKKYESYFNIIFLDIDMPMINGKEVARQLRILDKKFKLVFLTSYEQEVLNSFQYDVSDFIPKMLVSERFPSVIDRVINSINEENPQIQLLTVINENKNIMTVKIPLDDIEYFECINRKICMHTKRRVFILHGYHFSQIIELYQKYNFVTIHRTCIVNIKYIFSVDELEIRLDDGERLPISRRKKQQIYDKFIMEVSEGI